MRNLRCIAFVLIGNILGGCATTVDPNYALQLQAYQEAERSRQTAIAARAHAEEARYNAIAQVAERGDRETKTMAMMALALGGEHGGAVQEVAQQVPRIPETDADRAYKWAALFVGPVSNVAFGYFGYRLGVTQSNNAANQSIASTNALAVTASQGFRSNGQIAGKGFDAISDTATAGFAAVKDVAANPPSISIGGNGAISTGSGDASYSTTTTTTTNTNNNNRNCSTAGGSGGTNPPTPTTNC
jgi:hypothetical protein